MSIERFTLATLDSLCFSMYLMISDWAMLTEYLLLVFNGLYTFVLTLFWKGSQFRLKMDSGPRTPARFDTHPT